MREYEEDRQLKETGIIQSEQQVFALAQAYFDDHNRGEE